MTRPEEHDVYKERQFKNSLSERTLKEFFVKKDAFESFISMINLSDEERNRMLKALEFAYHAGASSRDCATMRDSDASNRIQEFYWNVYRYIKTGSYVADIPEQPMSDDDYKELAFGD